MHAPLLRAADPTLSSYQVEPRLKEVRNDHICTAQRLEDWVFWADQPLFLVVTEQEETDDQSEEERDRYPNPNSNFS